MDKLLEALMKAQQEAIRVNSEGLMQLASPFLKQFRDEHRVIPSVGGLPRIIRAFVRD